MRRSSPFASHRNLLLLIALFGGAVSLLLLRFDISSSQIITVFAAYFSVSVIAAFSLFGLLVRFAVQAGKEQGGSWSQRFEGRIGAWASSGELRHTLLGLLAVALVLSFFSMAKSILSFYVPFYADPYLAEADRFLHGGVYPHDWLLPMVKGNELTLFFNNAYIVWFIVFVASIAVACCCDPNTSRRLRFLWTFCLSWIICGTGLAWLFSSCGPIYYHLYYPDLPDPYTNLMEWLPVADKGNPVQTLEGREFLHSMITDDVIPDVNGISSMPSQHVAIAWLVALYARSINRMAGVLAFSYAIVILLGSVVLAWHYAIDGYVGIIIVSLLWWGIGHSLNSNKNSEPETV